VIALQAASGDKCDSSLPEADDSIIRRRRFLSRRKDDYKGQAEVRRYFNVFSADQQFNPMHSIHIIHIRMLYTYIGTRDAYTVGCQLELR
jgi:hypothetical protein